MNIISFFKQLLSILIFIFASNILIARQAQPAPRGGGGIPFLLLILIIVVIIVLSKTLSSKKFQKTSKNLNKEGEMKKTFTVGLIILILGVALIIVSQTVSFTSVEHFSIGGFIPDSREVENEALKNALLYVGIAALVIGGIIFSIGLGNLSKTK